MNLWSKVSAVFMAMGALGLFWYGCSSDTGGTLSISNNRVYLMNAEQGRLVPMDQEWAYSLILENVSPTMLWYTDRPDRQSGTISMESFVTLVWPNVFGDIAPNAVLDAWIPPNESNDGLFLILRNPSYDSKTKRLSFDVVLENSTMEDKRPETPIDFEDVKITLLNNNEDGQTDTYSFAQVAPSAYFESTSKAGVYRLYLNHIRPASYYLADAPDRFSFVYPTSLLEAAWQNLFDDDPPNASMTAYTEEDELKIQIMTLDQPVYNEETHLLTYRATLLHGDVQEDQTLMSPTLFIDDVASQTCKTQMGAQGFTKRLTVLNSCGENTWLYLKIPDPGSMPEQWDFWQKTSGGEEVWTGGSPGQGDAYVRSKLKVGVPYHFCIPDKGAASGNFQVFMEPCKKTGDDCMIGTLTGNDRNGVNTLIEFTFGCIPGTSQCSKNPAKPTQDLTAVDWFDVSAVAGYTVPVYLEVTNAQKLTCSAASTDASMLDMASCPSENTPWPDGYGTTMVAVDPAPETECGAQDHVCTGTGYAPCQDDGDCTDGNTQMRSILDGGFSLLTQDVDGRNGYQGCVSPCQYLTGHQLGDPPKAWTSPSGDIMGAMSSAGYPNNTLPLNTACWYCCASTATADAPGQGAVQCDNGPSGDGSHPIGLTGYVRRLKEMGMDGYSWQYDDYDANHNCAQKSPDTSARFLVTLCPGTGTGAAYPWPTGAKPFLKTQGWNWVDGKCAASNSGGTYPSLYACQTANLKYACKPVLSGTGDVSHNFCLPVDSGGQSYENCQKTCY